MELVQPRCSEFVQPTSFQSIYYRNYKSGGRKNLRCFPSCNADGHNNFGYCGGPLTVKITSTSKVVPFAHITLADNSFLTDIGGKIQKSFFLNNLRDLKHPLHTWSSCNEAISIQANQQTFELNPNFYAWHYGWAARQFSQTKIAHQLRVYFVTPCEHDVNYYTVCDILFSHPFQVLSTRGKRSKDKAACETNPPAPLKQLENIPSLLLKRSYVEVKEDLQENTHSVTDYKCVVLSQTAKKLSSLYKVFVDTMQFPRNEQTYKIMKGLFVHLTRPELISRVREFMLINQQSIKKESHLTQAYGDLLLLFENEIGEYLAGQNSSIMKILEDTKISNEKALFTFPFIASSRLQNMRGFLLFASQMRQAFISVPTIHPVSFDKYNLRDPTIMGILNVLNGYWKSVISQSPAFKDKKLAHIGLSQLHLQLAIEAFKKISFICNGFSLKAISRISVLPKTIPEYILDGQPHFCPISIFGTPLTVNCLGDYLIYMEKNQVIMKKFFHTKVLGSSIMISRMIIKFLERDKNTIELAFRFECLEEPADRLAFEQLDCIGRCSMLTKRCDWQYVHHSSIVFKRISELEFKESSAITEE